MKKILLVDNDPSHLDVCNRILTKKGYHVRDLSDGRLLLDVAKTFMPDLIFMDHDTPHMRGLYATQMLKGHVLLRHIPIIYFSWREEDRGPSKAAGADAFLGKPFKVEALVDLTAQLVGEPSV